LEIDEIGICDDLIFLVYYIEKVPYLQVQNLFLYILFLLNFSGAAN